MSVISRAFGRVLATREQEARRHLEIYLRTADRDLLAEHGSEADMAKVSDPKYLPF